MAGQADDESSTESKIGNYGMKQYKGLTSLGGVDLSQIPQALFDNLDALFKDKDIEIVKFMGHGNMDKSFKINKLHNNFKKNDIHDAFKRGIISKCENDESSYTNSTLPTIINLFATQMLGQWNCINKEDREAIANWHYDRFLDDKRAMGLEGMQKNKNQIAPLDETIEFVKTIDGPINLINCDCKAKLQRCDFEKNVCIEFNGGPNSPMGRGWGKPITKDETIELLKKTEALGLIHSIEAHAICNCCTCCCYPIRGSFALDLVHTWPEHAYQVVMNDDDCLSCGTCIDRCQFEVFTQVDGETNADTKKCWGCGICTSTCPVEALSLEKKQT